MWGSVSEKMNSAFELEIKPYEDDGLTFISPTEKETRSLKFDGKDYPIVGPNAGPDDVSSGRRVNERSVEITKKSKGKARGVRQIELSPDLKSLTVTMHARGQNKANVLVFDRE